jgi:hypothetical protein
MTDEEWQKFQQGRQAQTGGGPTGDTGKVPSYDPLNLAMSAVKGAGKEAIQGVEKWTPGPSLRDVDASKDPLMGWAGSKDAEHPWAEQVGRTAADVAPLAALPEMGIGDALSALGATARYARPLGKLGEAGWKGAVGGASQSKGDVDTAARVGGETGVGSQALRMAIGAIPHRGYWGLAAGLPALAAMAYSSGRRGMEPWWLYHVMREAAPGLAGLAGTVAPPGVAGALGEKAAQETGYDRSNQPKPESGQ